MLHFPCWRCWPRGWVGRNRTRYRSTIIFIAVLVGSNWARADLSCFGDLDWKKLQTSGQSALVYVWSPRMVLSATQAAIVKAHVIDLKLGWLALHDDRLPASEVAAALQTLQRIKPASAQALATSRPLCASDLYRRDAYLHFPTAFLLSRGVVHPAKIVGAMPASFWSAALTERLDQLRASSVERRTGGSKGLQ